MSEKKKHAGGRPTKYTPELLEKAHEYADGAWKDEDAVPMIVGLALHCDISKQRVYEWMKDDDKAEFRDIAPFAVLFQKIEQTGRNEAVKNLNLGGAITAVSYWPVTK